jgi:hypothetical protein
MSNRFAWAIGSIALFAAGPALATGPCPKALQFFGDDTGVITWQSPRIDSPRDPNKSRLAVHVLSQSGDDFAGAFNDCTGIEGRTLPQVRNLSFDFLNQSTNPVHIGNGSPAIRVLIDTNNNGAFDSGVDEVATLAAFFCGGPVAVLPENTAWSRADFTGRTAPGCDVWLNSNGVTPAASSDGVNSAWANFAAANPTWKVISAFFILDEVGTAFIDRLAFHNRMFIQAGSGSNAVKNCPSESSC